MARPAARAGPEHGADDVVVRVVPDVTGLDKHFDYLADADSTIEVGSLVRVVLHGRTVVGWVVGVGVDPDVPRSELHRIVAVLGFGVAPDVVPLAEWATTRWASRRVRPFLVAATSARRVTALPGSRRHTWPPGGGPQPASPATTRLLQRGGGVLRLPPAADVVPSILSAVAFGPTLVVVPSQRDVAVNATRLRRSGVSVATPGEWADAAAGVDVVIGTRSAAWAPCPGLAAGLVIDEHDESLQEERTPSWHARDVLAERCRRAGAAFVAVSPIPSLESLERYAGRDGVVAPPRDRERAGWPALSVVDRTVDEPWKRSLVTSELIAVLRDRTATVVCISNTTGRARLLACRSCRTLARCERCDAAVGAVDDGRLRCRRCGEQRPPVCSSCGAGRFANLRPGVTRLREELEGAAARPVVAVTAADDSPPISSGVYVGTEAALHRVRRADVVAFLEFDAEMLAPRFRASEQALALIARAGRVAPRVMVQTFVPEHEVVRAAADGDVEEVMDVERARRRLLDLPPFSALALVSGAGSEEFVDGLRPIDDLTIAGLGDGRFLVRAPDHDVLGTLLNSADRPPGGRLRVEVDPLRV